MSAESTRRIKPRSTRSIRTGVHRVRRWIFVLVAAAVIVPSVAFAAQAGGSGTLTRYEQTSVNVAYLGTWVTFTTTGASGGNYRYADSPATALISFTGSQLDLIATKGFTMGKARVTVDGAASVVVDFYNPTTLRQQKVWSTGTLSQGAHTVTVSWLGQASVSSGGTRVNIDAVDVAGTLSQASLATIEETDSRLAYSGTWKVSSSGSASGGHLSYTGAAQSSAVVVFNGTDVRYVAKTAPGFGRVKLTLDEGSPVDVDLYSSRTKYRQVVWSAFGLNPGNHTLRIERTGKKSTRATGTAVNLDALLVAESLTPTSSAAGTPVTTTTTVAPTTTTTAATPPVTATTVAPTTTTAPLPPPLPCRPRPPPRRPLPPQRPRPPRPRHRPVATSTTWPPMATTPARARLTAPGAPCPRV